MILVDLPYPSKPPSPPEQPLGTSQVKVRPCWVSTLLRSSTRFSVAYGGSAIYSELPKVEGYGRSLSA